MFRYKAPGSSEGEKGKMKIPSKITTLQTLHIKIISSAHQASSS